MRCLTVLLQATSPFLLFPLFLPSVPLASRAMFAPPAPFAHLGLAAAQPLTLRSPR